MLELRDRLCVITGASSGIGAELAIQLAQQGARLALCARRLERLEQLSCRLSEMGTVPPLICRCDVGEWSQVAEFAARVERGPGQVDVLIANAGRGAFQRFELMDPAVARAVVQTNLLGVVYCLRAFLPAMLASGQGRLVLVSSVLGELPAPQHAVYGATKFAVSGLAESLQYELEGTGVGVTLVEPGLVRSEFAQVSGTPVARLQQVPSKSPEAVAGEIIRAIRRGRSKLVADPASRLAIAFRRHLPRMARLVFGAALRRLYGRT